jgi:hypothetical protein
MRGGVAGFHGCGLKGDGCGLKGDGCGLKGDGCGLKGEFFLLSCSIGFT